MRNQYRILPLLASALAIGTFLSPSATFAQSTQNTDQVLRADTFIKVAQKAMPSVVSINVELVPDQDLLDQHDVDSLDELRDKIFSGDPKSRSNFWRNFDPDMIFGEIGSGSGVIVKTDDEFAYVVTNGHVIESSGRVKYTIVLDGSYDEIPVEVESPNVEVIGTDELTDLAVMKFNLPENITVKPIEFADSDEAMIGEFVLALGNPLDLNNSMSQGIISAKNRNITEQYRQARIEQLLQTTAVINPGNSGGPLVNLDGNIIGINNAIATTTGRWAGVGFAIPSNQARRISDMLIETGEVSRGYLGIMMTNAKELIGVEITEINPDTPAEKAGLKRGDVVTRVDGVRITNTRSLLTEIGNHLAGDSVIVEVVRESEGEDGFELPIILTQRPAEKKLSVFQEMIQRKDTANDSLYEDFGFELADIEIDGVSGLKVSRITKGSDAYKRGLRQGDIVTKINGIKLEDDASIFDALKNIEPGQKHSIHYTRDDESKFIMLNQ